MQNKTHYRRVTLFARSQKSQRKYIFSNSGWKLSLVINKQGLGPGGTKRWTSLLNPWMLHIRISLSTNFQLKLTIAIFWTKFAKKGSYFQSKTDKIDTTIEFCIFELVFVSNFTLNKQFWIFGPNLPKKDIYGQKQKMSTSLLNFAYPN